MSTVIRLNERRAAKQYNEVYSQKCCNFDLRLDDVIVTRKEKSGEIRKRMIKGYLSMLSNQK